MIRHFKHYKLWVFISSVLAIALIALVLSLGRNNVEYIHPRYGDVVESIYGLGKVKTRKFYELKLGIIKTVDRLYVQEGDTVSKGQRMVRMDDGTVFSAPMAGTVTLVALTEAQQVFPQQTILRLEDLQDKYIEVSLEQQGALRVQKGQPVRVLFESIRGEVLTGQVDALFPRNEEFLVHINVAGLADNVLPGMTADVAIEVGKKSNVLLVPLSGVQNGQVRIKRGDKTQVVSVKLGNIDGNWAEITEGDIRPDDQVIVMRRR
jgi:multidrug efflux pump subunit AcrA (membrane-fusion protein)